MTSFPPVTYGLESVSGVFLNRSLKPNPGKA
jgi:hypothetical protein